MSAGAGLEGVPRGTVKALRVYEYHFAYPRMGGHISIGIDGPWDVRRIHGTVRVEADGSALFKVPANIPFAVQPLDAEGKALQVMRSWMTAMPGEVLSCAGCHEKQNSVPSNRKPIALTKAPQAIQPWYGPARGFNFRREVQPVLDKYCVGCHNDDKRKDGKTIPNFARREKAGMRNFDQSYLALHPYVRRPGPESDYHLQKPSEWHADTSELVQMLQKGHQGVKLDAEAWDRLITWIDLNVPCHGTWSEHRKIAANMHRRRLESRTKYANRPEDPEKYPTPPPGPVAFVKPAPIANRKSKIANPPGWPFDTAEAKKRQQAAAPQITRSVDLGNGVKLDLALIPAGKFLMGDTAAGRYESPLRGGEQDERPQAAVAVGKPFWMGKFEVTNALYALFDPRHDSAYISVFNKDQGNRGVAVNRPRQPVIRISWQQATAFCRWLSEKTGESFALPTEAQWEFACRAGAATPLNYGAVGTDFGKLANFADQRVLTLCRRDSPKWIPAINSVNDGAVVTTDVGRYPPNAWGLHDMHGNVAEWTRSLYRPYPYRDDDGRNDLSASGRRVIRGGSFYDRPHRGRSAFRLSHPSWRKVYNVGFRVVCEAKPKKIVRR